MQTLIIVVHPNLDSGSRIHNTLTGELRKLGDAVTIHELYREYPDDRIDVEREQRLMQSHDKIILQFPMWWYSSPYLLKKWIDEVLTYSWAYGPGGDKLRGKKLGLAISTGGAASAFQAGGYNQFSISEMMKPFQATCSLIGMEFMPMFVIHGAMGMPDEQLEQSAASYVEYVLAPVE